ncbi:reductase [Lactobacillus sp. LL6]|uniref:reductase n=1 Tax=Lactobacillus sp. LL6 TaxID=2596827 RepID=UPI001184DB3A|nr:reductase [Lactobacillus sp. LL6]TSO26255.1 reductase [Lactobacillus sp. LL6]
MLIEYKKDNEKVAMGLLSYLSDFKNLENLKEEIKLNRESEEFKLYLYKNEDNNVIGVIGTQINRKFIIVRYLSLAPGFREKRYEIAILKDLATSHPKLTVTAVPEYTFLIKDLNNSDE